jgi:hypothetical protein
MKRRQCANRIAFKNGSYPCDREGQVFVEVLGAWFCRECLREVAAS